MQTCSCLSWPRAGAGSLARRPFRNGERGVVEDRKALLKQYTMLQHPRGYLTLAWCGLVGNALVIPLTVAFTVLEPTWRTTNIAVGAGAVLPSAVVGLIACLALIRWRAWGRTLAIVALALDLAVGVPYGIVRMALLDQDRPLTAVLSGLLWAGTAAALIYWCRPSIRRYLT